MLFNKIMWYSYTFNFEIIFVIHVYNWQKIKIIILFLYYIKYVITLQWKCSHASSPVQTSMMPLLSLTFIITTITSFFVIVLNWTERTNLDIWITYIYLTCGRFRIFPYQEIKCVCEFMWVDHFYLWKFIFRLAVWI